MNLNASPLPGTPLSTSGRQIFGVGRRDQSHVNIRHEVLDWFGPSRGVIAIHPILMYYAIEIDSSLFLSGSFGGFQGFSGCLPDVIDVDLYSLFIVGEPTHRV
jgi:hypothetical protein